jgi:hypothetical protein
MAILNNSNAISTAGAYNLTNSLRFRSSASAYLSRTPASSGNRRTWTWSGWVKRGTLSVQLNVLLATKPASSPTNNNTLQFSFNSDNALTLGLETAYFLTTTQVFRDPSAWYHIMLAVDTTQATASNRVRIYINGSEVTSFSVDSRSSITQNQDLGINLGSQLHQIGALIANTWLFDGYMDEINFIDGQQLTPSSFGSTNTTTGVWQPERYTGTYGTNGYYLNFTNIALTSGSNTGLGQDFSGNGNFWNTNNISVTTGVTYDAMSDVPTLTSATAANYATWNPVVPYVAGIALSNGNLNIAYSSGSGATGVLGTIGIASGKWYWEYTFTASNPNFYLGWRTPDGVIYFGVGCSTGNVLTETSSGSFSGSTVTVANGDVIGVAFDYAAGACYYYKNNTLFFTLTGFTTSNSTLFPIRNIWSSGGGASSGATNFGQRPFAYTPPSGYLGLNTFNLPDSTIVKGNTVMDATLYTGNGGTQTITNAGGFRPDLVWQKSRSSSAWHNWIDVVRGVGNRLFSNDTGAESFAANSLTSFNSNGFSIGAATDWNANGQTNVAWQWQAGSSTVTNTSGSISSQVRANTTAGFSVVTYTGNGTNGATIGHGLGVAPRWVIVKRRNSSGDDWLHYHISLGATQSIAFDTAAAITSSTRWNNTAPSSTVVTLGTSTGVNGSGATYVAYCWAEIAGFSRFGSYIANASSDGPFIYTGFRPKWIMFKRSTSSTNWYLIDTSVSPINASTAGLYPNTSAGESTEGAVDIVSNGFKCRVSSGAFNFPSGETFIYAAFAENPFKNALAR